MSEGVHKEDTKPAITRRITRLNSLRTENAGANKEDETRPKTPVELEEEIEARNKKILEEQAEIEKKTKLTEKKLEQARAKQALKQQKEAREEKLRQEEYRIQLRKMNQQQIQQQITSFVPEFSGEDQINQSSQIKRFLGTATSIYNELTTEEEKTIFTKLIKFRLTGDAYTRIQDTETRDFNELTKILQNMYTRTYSLNELEKQYTETQQTYGETIRNYGYRLNEALNKYKNAFKLKYTLQNIGEAYNTHLQENSVQLFKRGLNNTILREKVATSRAKTLEEIIEETETIEKMLTATTGTLGLQPVQPLPQWPTQNSRPKSPVKTHPTICNYCQKPNHTWDKCRTRMYAEEAKLRKTQYGSNPNPVPQYRQYQQNNQYQGNRPQYNPRWNNQTPQQNTQRNPPQYHPQNRYIPPQQNPNFNPNVSSQNTQPNFRAQPTIPTQFTGNRQNKYCSHCKVTTSHTFDECRSKYFSQRNPNRTAMQHKPDTENLTENFNRLKINRISPQQEENRNAQYPPDHPQYSENPNGSSQL